MEGGLMAHLLMDIAIEGPLVDTLMMDEYDEDEFFDPDHLTEHVYSLSKQLCEDPSEERAALFNRALSQCMAEMATADSHMKGHFLMSIRRMLGSDLNANILCPRLDWDFFARLEPCAFSFRELYQQVCKIVGNAGGSQLAWLQLTQRYIVAANDKKYTLIASYLGLLADILISKRLHTSVIYDHVNGVLKRFEQWIPIMDASVMEPYPEWDEDFNVDEDMMDEEYFDEAQEMNYRRSLELNGRRDVLSFMSQVAAKFGKEERGERRPRQWICRTKTFMWEDDTDGSLSAGNSSPQEVQIVHQTVDSTAVDEIVADNTAVDDTNNDGTTEAANPLTEQGENESMPKSDFSSDSDSESDSSDEKGTLRMPSSGNNKNAMAALNRHNRSKGKRLLLTMVLKHLAKLLQVSNMGACASLLRSRIDPFTNHPRIYYGRYEAYNNHSLWVHCAQMIMNEVELNTEKLVDHIVSGKPKLQLSDEVDSESCELGAFVLLVVSKMETELQASFLREPYLTKKQFWLLLPAIKRMLKADKQAEGIGDLLLHCLMVHQRHLLNGKKRTSAKRLKTVKKLLKDVLDFSATCSVPSLAAAALSFVSSCLRALKREEAQRKNAATSIEMDEEIYNIVSDHENDDRRWKSECEEEDGGDVVSKADMLWKYGPYVVSKAKQYVINNETNCHSHIISPEFIHADDVDGDGVDSVWKAADTEDVRALRVKVERLGT